MVFNSLQFALFLPAVVGVYWSLRARGQLWLILVASYVFYGYWDWRFLSLLVLSTLVDYSVGRGLGSDRSERSRRRLLWVSLVVNLGVLAGFKYADFFVDSAVELLETAGLSAQRPVLEVVLPVGISFYTFQTMSYTIDVYRRRLEPIDDLLTFAVYVAFFPQLVAGPIERAGRLLPQLAGERTRPDADGVAGALSLIALGLFKKVVVGDMLAAAIDREFADPTGRPTLALLFAMYGFALVIYADFSGYSDIARGSARLLGVELVRNFEQPYLSRNITEFWRRWHISLSDWLRDYLYIPLGGNRGGRLRTYRNLALTMLLGGLWHGASWTFVVWGGAHGLLLALERLTGRSAPTREQVGPGDLGSILLTFHAVSVIWILFRADSFATAGDFLLGLIRVEPGSPGLELAGLVVVMAVVLVTVDVAQRRTGRHDVFTALAPPVRGVLLGAAIVAVILASGRPAVPFIYFQF